MRRAQQFVLCMFCVVAMSGCTLYKKPDVPTLQTPKTFKSNVKVTHAALKDQWWRNFHDEKLNQLVKLAIENNYSYQVAIKNIEIACTFVLQNISNWFPQVNLNFSSSRNKFAQSILNGFVGNAINPGAIRNAQIFNLQELSGSIAYQVDVWNQIGNSVKQAQANQSVSEADSRGVKLTVINSVVNTYFQMKALNVNIANLKQQLHAANEITALYQTQYRSGLIDYSVLDDAKNQSEAVKENLSTAEKQRQVLQYALAYLCGQYPENFTIKVAGGFDNFKTNNAIPAGVPANMLGNRPDIQNAYYQILSYGYLEKQTIANFLPSISLTGNYGYASSAFNGLLNHVHSYWNYGLYATQYVFDYMNRISQYHRADYQYQQAILNYRNVVINSFKEVDSALSSYKHDNEALRAYQKQYFNSKDKLRLADSQYQAGLTDYPTYLATKLSYLQSDYNYTNQKLAVTQDILQVYVTLGMGVA